MRRSPGAIPVLMAKDASAWEERIATEAVFRAANEQLAQIVGRQGLAGRMPLVCECADPTCRELLRVPVEDYEWARSQPTRFLNLPGHESAALGTARVVAEREGYVIVEKTGHTAQSGPD